jgi:hypothetical protein
MFVIRKLLLVVLLLLAYVYMLQLASTLVSAGSGVI